jgi:hypothetical protein
MLLKSFANYFIYYYLVDPLDALIKNNYENTVTKLTCYKNSLTRPKWRSYDKQAHNHIQTSNKNL